MVKHACLLFFYFYFFFLNSYGQETVSCVKDSDFVTISALDNFPCYNKGCKGNGERDLLKFIEKKINYPETALQDTIEGTVIVSYIVELDGSTSKHKILKSVRNDIDIEALRICKMIKYAEPAKQANKPVRVKMELPIKFLLSSLKNFSQ